MAVNPKNKPAAAAPARVAKTAEVKPGVICRPGFCRVVDTNCNHDYPVRKHEMEHELWPLTNSIKTTAEVPHHIAIKFLRDVAFKVYDSSGTLLELMTPTDGSAMKLNKGECIAKLSELRKECLLLRAQRMAGGSAFNVTTRSETLIEFIMAGGAVVPIRGVEDTDADEMASADNLTDDQLIEDEEDDGSSDTLASILDGAAAEGEADAAAGGLG